MAELRQSLHALVEHPLAPPSPMDVVAARGARFARRRRAARSASALLTVAAVATAGLVVAQREPGKVVTADRGVAVAFTDPAGDAVGAVPTVTGYDLVRVAVAPAGTVDPQRPGDYTISITIAGAADEEASYVLTADFGSGTADERCQIFHYLALGRTAGAKVFCGSTGEGTKRLVGGVEGGPVTSTPTSGGGTELVATFDASTLPTEAAGQVFIDLWALTACPESRPGCRLVYMDEARSKLTYRP